MIMGVPYDAEVAYLESTGTQYIDIPVSVTAGEYFGIKGRMMATDSYVTTGNANARRILDTNISGQFTSYAYSLDAQNGTVLYATTVGGDPIKGGITIGYKALTDFELSTEGRTRPAGYEPLPRPLTVGFSTLRLFGKLATEGSSTFGSVAIQSLEIKVGNTIRHKLIPVRVGSGANAVGYMYDRVSKRLFGNQGTGNFTIGEDVATPVMGIWKYKPTARDYVQEGLVAMWDGIENAGWGVHDANATGPFNLATGRADSFDKENSGVSFTWSENYLSYSGGWIQFNNLNTNIRYALNTNYKTLEFIGDFQPTNPSTWPSSANIWSLQGNAQNAFQYRRGSRLAYWDNNYSNVSWSSPAVTVVRDGDSFSYYGNGVLLKTATGSNVNYANNISVRCSEITSGTFKVYCIRLYSRALTAAEIAHNYAIDQERFGVGLTQGGV